MASGTETRQVAMVMLLLLASLAFAGWGRSQSNRPAVSAPIGLEIGQKAPALAATDQFGHQQSNETLKGSNGTILLFFRSADW